ncbi:glycosyltransferase family 2 protein [Actinomyces bovis]|uniref:glycosyltransferase family 2 protein n=1 Tax=Actinomyces bovis TaxID=1658 RepID=UPI0014745554|nr:glycosyltransferase family 2 protein [Actinomyces bovis]
MTALLVTYNEAQHVSEALSSLLCQDYPTDMYEIIVIDGRSEDSTVEVAKSTVDNYIHNNVAYPQIRFLENPNRTLAAGWNRGFEQAKGRYVVRIDAHSTVGIDFLSTAVRSMKEHPCAAVGGRLETVASTQMGIAMRNVVSSRFGVGNSTFRVSNRPGYVDTVVYGLYDRKWFDSVGGFDESLQRSQDLEFHLRITNAGGRFYFDPRITATYFPRSTLTGLTRQAFGNGYWNMVLLRRSGSGLAIRHVVPLLFVLALSLSVIIGAMYLPVFWGLVGVLAVYGTLACISALRMSRNASVVGLTMLGYFVFHSSYGIGSIVGLLRAI